LCHRIFLAFVPDIHCSEQGTIFSDLFGKDLSPSCSERSLVAEQQTQKMERTQQVQFTEERTKDVEIDAVALALSLLLSLSFGVSFSHIHTRALTQFLNWGRGTDRYVMECGLRVS